MAFSTSHVLWLSLLFVLRVGFCMTTQMASSNTLIQTVVPDALRGRVIAAYTMMLMSMTPFGALLGGTIANHIGAPATLAMGRGVCMLAALLYRRRLPVFQGVLQVAA